MGSPTTTHRRALSFWCGCIFHRVEAIGDHVVADPIGVLVIERGQRIADRERALIRFVKAPEGRRLLAERQRRLKASSIRR